MDPPPVSPDRWGPSQGAGVGPSGLRRYGLNFSASSLLQAPIAALLEYSGVVQSGPALAAHHPSAGPSSPLSASEVDGLLSAAAAGDGEVSIRIQGGPGDTEATGGPDAGTSSEDLIEATAGSEVDQASAAGRGAGATDAEANGGGAGTSGNGGGDRAYQRYDVHHVARWFEQILPFSLLLLVVFIRQHLQGLLHISLSKCAFRYCRSCCFYSLPSYGSIPRFASYLSF
jgi:E3 ubiquitin-protein ligase RNFT1